MSWMFTFTQRSCVSNFPCAFHVWYPHRLTDSCPTIDTLWRCFITEGFSVNCNNDQSSLTPFNRFNGNSKQISWRHLLHLQAKQHCLHYAYAWTLISPNLSAEWRGIQQDTSSCHCGQVAGEEGHFRRQRSVRSHRFEHTQRRCKYWLRTYENEEEGEKLIDDDRRWF